MTICIALPINALEPGTLKVLLRALALGLLTATGCMSAWGQDDPLLQQRRQELRSMVRQQQPVAAGPSATLVQASGSDNAASAANQRHLSFEERTELRRQLARDLRAQRGTGNTLQQ